MALAQQGDQPRRSIGEFQHPGRAVARQRGGQRVERGLQRRAAAGGEDRAMREAFQRAAAEHGFEPPVEGAGEQLQQRRAQAGEQA